MHVKVRNSTSLSTRQRTQYVLKPEVIASYIFTKEFKWMKKMMHKKCMGDMKNVNAQKNNLFQTFVFPSFLKHTNEWNGWQKIQYQNQMQPFQYIIELLVSVSNYLAKFLYCIPGILYVFNIKEYTHGKSISLLNWFWKLSNPSIYIIIHHTYRSSFSFSNC